MKDELGEGLTRESRTGEHSTHLVVLKYVQTTKEHTQHVLRSHAHAKTQGPAHAVTHCLEDL